MKINKFQALVDKMEVELKHEKLENKANLIQIKKLQADIISMGSEPRNAQATKKLLEEKYNTIQVLKKKLKIPNNEHAQSTELFTLQEEKDKFYQEMMDYKGKSLKLQEEKNKWEAEKAELMTHISKLKKDKNDENEIMEQLMSQTPIYNDSPLIDIDKMLNEFFADDLLVPMS